jgi:hypothetical protein
MSLLDDLLLLAFDDAGRDTFGMLQLDYVLAGAVLTELAIAGRAQVSGSKLVLADVSKTGEPVLDKAIELIAAARKPRRVESWIPTLSSGLRRTSVQWLLDQHVLHAVHDRVLWIFPRTRYVPTGGGIDAEFRLRRTLESALDSNGPVDARAASLLSLLRAIDVLPKVFPARDAKKVNRRVEEIASGEWASAAVKKAVESMQAAILATTVVTTTAAVASSS